MSAQPVWDESGQGDLLALVAIGSLSSPSPTDEWQDWLDAAATVAQTNGGIVDPNALRELTRDVVAPQRCGAFTHRALSLGLMEPADWVVSTDAAGKNRGKPSRRYTWIGGGR